MKVLVISSKFFPEYAGSALRAETTYKRLSEKFDLSYEVICNSVEFSNSKKYIHNDVTVLRISESLNLKRTFLRKGILAKIFFIANYYLDMIATLKAINKEIDLIHTFGNSASVAAVAYFSRWIKKPMIIELCNYPLQSPYPQLPICGKFISPDFKRGKVIVAISQELESLCNKFGLKENVWCRPNPIGEDVIVVKSERERQSLRMQYTSFTSNDIVLTYVAKFIPRKNHIFLLDVLRLLPEKYKLVLAGPLVSKGSNRKRDMECVAKFENKIDELGLRRRVKVKYKKVDIARYLGFSDLFMQPSWDEALGTPVLESIGSGVPVIANKQEGAFGQWIKNGFNGFLCDLNAAEWAEVVQKMEGFSVNKRKISEDIFGVSSAKLIDAQYYKAIKGLVECGYKGKINVDRLLGSVDI